MPDLAHNEKNGPQALGRSRGGLSTKIHALVEGLGQLARFVLTPGQAGDITCAHGLLEGVQAQAVVADAAFDAAHLRETLAARSIKAVIPSHPRRTMHYEIDRHQNRHRNLVERWFARIKHFRRIATRYDKLASRYASFVSIPSIQEANATRAASGKSDCRACASARNARGSMPACASSQAWPTSQRSMRRGSASRWHCSAST